MLTCLKKVARLRNAFYTITCVQSALWLVQFEKIVKNVVFQLAAISTLYLLIYIEQISLDGLTGPVNFNEYGQRKKTDLEILNLRNNSFKKVGGIIGCRY